jgi:adenylate cyclase
MSYRARRKSDKISFFSIGTKLVLIISLLVLMSLGSITALVSFLVSQDLRVTAEANNFEVNRRSALEAENIFLNIRANSLVLIQLIHTAGTIPETAARIFFEQNDHIAALAYTGPGGRETLFVSPRFFASKDLDEALADDWQKRNIQLLNRGTSMILNETPHFAISLLTFTFPWYQGLNAAVLFSVEYLVDILGSGTNQSYLVNSEDDVLIHSDLELVRAAANFSDYAFIQEMRKSPQRNMQTLYTDDTGVRHFGAFTKMSEGGAALVTFIEYDKVFEGIVATTWRNIYLTIAVLSISIILIWFFAKTISVPLKILAVAARQIEGGEFDLNLKVKGSDEIGLLTSSFLKMSRALGIFGKFTNKEIALLAMRGQIKPGGLPKLATVFFSDIRNFTHMSEEFTKEYGDKGSDKIVLWLNEYLAGMVKCVEKTNGTIDKFIGDAVMAHWGTATTSGNAKQDALNCIISALHMRAIVHRMNKGRTPGDKGNPMINIGCGINTGRLTAGQIGSDQRMEYTVIGDAVNLASRIESLNKPLGTDILISESTWNMTRKYLICEEMPPVSVKGKEKPVRIFAVVNLAANTQGPKTLEQVRKILGIKAPDINVDVNQEENKYKVTSNV